MRRCAGITLVLSVLACSTVNAAEKHFHYHITFLVALAAGWSWEEAQLIASADLAIDENEETTASLEMTGRSQLLHISPKSLRFHCFSATDDRRASREHSRNPDVLENLASLEAQANTALDQARQNPHELTQALVAIGVYLHCQQDSWFHSGFGGHWDGHALESFLAMILEIPDPDHTAARPAKTERALDEMLEKLTSFRRRWGGPVNAIAPSDLTDLKRLLTHPLTKKMTKRERAACSQRLAGHWLYKLLSTKDQLSLVPNVNIREDLAKLSTRCQRVHAEVFSALTPSAWIVVPSPLPIHLGLDGRWAH